MRWEERRHRGAEVARNLQQHETRAEGVLWQALRGRKLAGLKFRRQHPVAGVVLDFSCPDHRLAIGVDGSVHDDLAERDAARSNYLAEKGYRVIRFRNEEVLNELPAVLRRILEAVQAEPRHS
jgi:very-short-patch-repair endonuclease